MPAASGVRRSYAATLCQSPSECRRTWRHSSSCRRRPMTLATKSPPGSHLCRSYATRTMITRCRHAMAIERFWRRDMSTEWRSSAGMKRPPCIRAATRRPISFTIRCIIWRCSNKRPRRSIKRRLWTIGDLGCVHRLRRLMEARMGTAGRREFVQVLRLMEDFHQHQVEGAVSEALRLGAISFDAVKMLLLAQLENRPARLDLTFYPY